MLGVGADYPANTAAIAIAAEAISTPAAKNCSENVKSCSLRTVMRALVTICPASPPRSARVQRRHR